MAVFETWLTPTDLKQPVRVEALKGVFFSADIKANKIGVEVMDGGQAASLSGSVKGAIIREDEVTVEVNGSLSGNKASIVLPQSAYAKPGQISIVIRLYTGDGAAQVRTVLGACTGYVQRSTTDEIVYDETVLPSIDELVEEIEAVTVGAMMLSVGTAIPSNSDLNNYDGVTNPIGNYRVNDTGVAATLTNSPITTGGFTLKVMYGQSTSMVLQWAINSSGALMYFRRKYQGEWTSWAKYTTAEASTSSAGLMSAADKTLLNSINTTWIAGSGSSSASLDSITAAGIYWVNSDSTQQGWPSGSGTGLYGVLEVLRPATTGAFMQRLSLTSGPCYFRTYANSTFGTWRRLTTT